MTICHVKPNNYTFTERKTMKLAVKLGGECRFQTHYFIFSVTFHFKEIRDHTWLFSTPVQYMASSWAFLSRGPNLLLFLASMTASTLTSKCATACFCIVQLAACLTEWVPFVVTRSPVSLCRSQRCLQRCLVLWLLVYACVCVFFSRYGMSWSESARDCWRWTVTF